MRRRSVLVARLALFIAPEQSDGQQPQPKIPRVGILTVANSETPMLDAFRAGLRDLGYVEGRNIILEFRFAKGDLTHGLELATELVSLPVDVIVIEGVPAANDPTGNIPIVNPALMDPVQRGFALSLARPGRNITGFTLMHTELNGKRLELLRTAFPDITAVSALVNPAAASSKLAFEQTETAARSTSSSTSRPHESSASPSRRPSSPAPTR
jgi:putative ABC transport system substrate-binding protein